MHTHAPPGYDCPFCRIARGDFGDGVFTVPGDIVLRTESVIAFIASHGYERNAGHVLVVPVMHFENLYAVPDEVGEAVFAVSRRIAVALKAAYGCAGTSVRQHNEPAGNQDVWHYHAHVFPRYAGDDLYGAGMPTLVPPLQRAPFAERLCAMLESSPLAALQTNGS